MTAEIIVLNREGVALATDSAVTSTLGNIDKISSSANKLFSLSDQHPVGIMIYGNSSFMGIPWETIIKVYRSSYLPSTGFSTLNEYSTHFISFLCHRNLGFHQFAESNYIESFITEILSKINNIILDNVQEEAKEHPDIGENDLLRIMHGVIDSAYTFHHNLHASFISIEQSRIIFRKYNKLVKSAIDAAFKDLALGSDYRSRMYELLVDAFSKSTLDNVSSGIVLAGFGENEFLPMVKAFKIEGLVKFTQNGKEMEILKYQEDQDKSSSPDTQAAVIPYALV